MHLSLLSTISLDHSCLVGPLGDQFFYLGFALENRRTVMHGPRTLAELCTFSIEYNLGHLEVHTHMFEIMQAITTGTNMS